VKRALGDSGPLLKSWFVSPVRAGSPLKSEADREAHTSLGAHRPGAVAGPAPSSERRARPSGRGEGGGGGGGGGGEVGGLCGAASVRRRGGGTDWISNSRGGAEGERAVSPGFTRRPARSKYPMFMPSRRHLTTKPDIKTPAIAYYILGPNCGDATQLDDLRPCTSSTLACPFEGAAAPCAPVRLPGIFAPLCHAANKLFIYPLRQRLGNHHLPQAPRHQSKSIEALAGARSSVESRSSRSLMQAGAAAKRHSVQPPQCFAVASPRPAWRAPDCLC